MQFRRTCGKYEQVFGPLITKVRRKYAGKPEEKLVKDSLEVHSKAYIVNTLLAALNWRLDTSPEGDLPNLLLEAPMRSEKRSTVRFLDYLGLERETNNPLLIVETKRLSANLPQAFELAATYSEIISRIFAGESLKGEWNQWLKDLCDYVRSAYHRTQKVPKRVVITNGDWLILFLDPSDAFLEGGSRNSCQILVFLNQSDIETRYHEVFHYLEHGRVLGEVPPLTPGELPFYYIEGTAVDRVIHGLRPRYIEQTGIYQSSPVIKVAPVLFLRSRYGAWLRVETPTQEYELPHEKERLLDHLNEVQEAARNFFHKVKHQLGLSFQPFSLSRHYADEDGFNPIRGVIECGRDNFLIVTGEKTHYLLPEPSVHDCPHHDWVACNRLGVACNPGPIMTRSIAPRSFFVSGELRHCAHRDVNSSKASQITASNRNQCGPRSGEEGQSFCEIWRFEEYLCCRSCVFEEVCTKAAVFCLPCEQRNINATVQSPI